ncbi:MAG: hypothetical protein NZ914_14845 [Gemmatales bacterium]|nr:hypothetical protein [Gemmatales bacterium]
MFTARESFRRSYRTVLKIAVATLVIAGTLGLILYATSPSPILLRFEEDWCLVSIATKSGLIVEAQSKGYEHKIALRARRLADWRTVWSIKLNGFDIGTGRKALSSNERYLAITMAITRIPGSPLGHRLVILDLHHPNPGTVVWEWPEQPIQGFVRGVEFVDDENLYCCAEATAQEPGPAIYHLNVARREAKLLLRQRDMPPGDGNDLRWCGYLKSTGEGLVHAYGKLLAVNLAEPTKQRVLLEPVPKILGAFFDADVADNGEVIAVAGGSLVLLQEPPDFKKQTVLEPSGGHAVVACSPDGQYIATTSITIMGEPWRTRIFSRSEKLTEFSSEPVFGGGITTGCVHWWPDGRHLAIEVVGGGWALWRLNLPKK